MPPSGDDPQTWEVLQSPAVRKQLDRYRPPAKDRPDPITLVGEPDRPGRRFHGLGRPFLTLFAVVLGLVAWAPRGAVLVAAIGLVLVFLVLLAFRAARAPVWKQPEVTVNGENLTVTDVSGVIRTMAWPDIERLHLVSVLVGATEELHLTVISARGGEDATANLGNTLDLYEVRKAIATRAPEGLELQVGPRRAIGPG